MLLRLVFSCLLILSHDVSAKEAEKIVLLGQVISTQERVGVDIEQRYVVKVLEQYEGKQLTLPLVDLRIVRDINTKLVTHTPEEKILFFATKLKSKSYIITEYTKFPTDYLPSVVLNQSYHYLLMDYLEKIIQTQLDKYEFVRNGKFDFVFSEKKGGVDIEFYRLGMKVYAFSALRFYLEKHIGMFSDHYAFLRPKNYRLEVKNKKVFIKSVLFSPQIKAHPKL